MAFSRLAWFKKGHYLKDATENSQTHHLPKFLIVGLHLDFKALKLLGELSPEMIHFVFPSFKTYKFESYILKAFIKPKNL